MRFELIDRVLERSADRLVAIKTVTSAEEYLGDHFPGFPVLPGVMMLEALVQAGRAFAEGSNPKPQANLVLTEVRNVKYANMVRPGQTLRVEVTLRGTADGSFDFVGEGKVDDQLAVQGRFRLSPLSPPTARA